MRKLQTFWEKISVGFWFLPSILVAFSIIAAFLTLTIDRIYVLDSGRVILDIFGGTAGAARELLSTIAGSLITVISIAFSVTIIALQQASTQYSPRVLRTFTRDKGNQLVLGTYLSTYAYALLILRSVREETAREAAFIPALSITLGLVLTLACIGLLVYFISHITTSLHVERIIKNIHTVLIDEIDNLFPKHIGLAVDIDVPGEELFDRLKGNGKIRSIKAKESGFVQSVDDSVLAKLKTDRVSLVFVLPEIGDFIVEGQVIIKVSENISGEEYSPDNLRNAVILDYQRSVEQDPLFAIGQLVDIALRALSPGVNDPTTAEYCLFQLNDALCRLADREFPSNRRTFEDSPAIFIFSRPTWSVFIEEAFGRIRRAAENNVHVTGTLIQQLKRLSTFVPEGNRSNPLRELLEETRAAIKKQSLSRRDTDILLRQIDEAERALEPYKRYH